VQQVCRLPIMLTGVYHILQQPFFLAQVGGASRARAVARKICIETEPTESSPKRFPRWHSSTRLGAVTAPLAQPERGTAPVAADHLRQSLTAGEMAKDPYVAGGAHGSGRVDRRLGEGARASRRIAHYWGRSNGTWQKHIDRTMRLRCRTSGKPGHRQLRSLKM
jgi:hypothetical protein